MKEKYFKFRESYSQAIQTMTDKEAGQFLKTICEYVFEDKKPKLIQRNLKSHFALAKIILDKEIKDIENGRIGGIESVKQRAKQKEDQSIIIEISDINCPNHELCKNIFSQEKIEENDSLKEKSVAKKQKK